MKDITIQSNSSEIFVLNLRDLLESFESITDPRAKRGKIYPLPFLLMCILLAKLSGQDTPTAIASWAKERKPELLHLFHFELPHPRIPCLNTFRSILEFESLIPEIERIFTHYLHENYGGQQTIIISIDGKTLRGTIAKGSTQGTHLLAAYLPEEGITLAQIEVKSKENEISALPKLLQKIPVKGRIICADAMQTQRKASAEIIRSGGDYIWIAKGNQPTLQADIERFFVPVETSFSRYRKPINYSHAKTVDTQSGRVETRTILVVEDKDEYLNWPGAKQVFRLERERLDKKTGKKTKEIIYGITSCPPEKLTAKGLLDAIRSYWGIENGLHFRRDATLNEDKLRTKFSNIAVSMATINNFIVGMTQKFGYENLAEARRIFAPMIFRQIAV